MYLSERASSGAEPGSPPAAGVPRGRVPSAVVALGAVSLLTDISSESVAAVLPLYLTAVLGISPLAFGLVDGLYQGVSALVRILGGYAADRLDRPKWVAFGGYAVSAATRAALPFATGLVAVSAVVSLDRLGKGVRTAPRDALIAASSPPAIWGRVFGVHRAMDTVGAALGPALAFLILWFVPGDYTSVFVASFAAAVLGLVVMVLFVPDLRPRRETARRDPVARPSLRLLTDRRLTGILLAAGVLGLVSISDAFLYLTLQDRSDLAATWFPLLFMGTNIAYFVLAVPLGRLADRVGRRRVFLAGHVLLVLAYLTAALPVSGVVAIVATLAALGAYYAATDGVLPALVAEVVPTELRGVGIATAQTVVAVARFVAALGFGLAWTLWGRAPAVLAFGALLAAAIVLAGWLLLRAAATEEGR